MSTRSALPPLSEEDSALLETLTPELARLLYPDQSSDPFTITVVYPELAGEAATMAHKLEASAVAHDVSEPGADAQAPLHRTTFSLQQIEEFHELYHLVEEAIGADHVDLMLNGRAVPLTRELWLPLIWTLRT